MSDLSHSDKICEMLREYGMEVEYVSLDGVDEAIATEIAIEGRLYKEPQEPDDE